ncbi:MAG TPA: hypothetical protein VH251_07840 [Verrucomicrobiae bacterium]|nr:hypothetical protein [Verrucomicrobiae bacterium]
MNNVLKINFGKRKRLTSLLGLSLDGSKLEGVVLRRTNGSLQVHESFSVTLSLDPLTAAPELVGREIRNHLEAAGVRERFCTVCLPLKWVLTATTELPPLPEADAASLLQIEAEKGFHSDIATLQLANSRCSLAGDKKYVLFAGIPKGQVESLIQVLTAAKLKPVSFSLGLTSSQVPRNGKDDGTLALMIGETGVGLQITCNGGIAALRTFEGAVANEGSRRVLHASAVAREARITLGQLPAELRSAVRRIRVYGPAELARQLADEMELGFEPMGFNVEEVTKYQPNEFGVTVPPDAPVSAAFSLAARCLAEQPPVFEFLPPRPTMLEQFVTKYSSGKMQTVGLVAAAIVVIVGGLFLIQEIELISLRSQWNKMSAKVADLQAVQAQIQRYQPWYDTSFRALTILRQLSLAFPEDGVVTAKSIEIRNGNTVTCSGTASDNGALLRTLSQLRATEGVGSVTVEQIRGTAPMQFTFDFQVGNVGRGQP